MLSLSGPYASVRRLVFFDNQLGCKNVGVICSSDCFLIEKRQRKIWQLRKKELPLHSHFKKRGTDDAPLAQLVEHLTLNQGVQGSNP